MKKLFKNIIVVGALLTASTGLFFAATPSRVYAEELSSFEKISLKVYCAFYSCEKPENKSDLDLNEFESLSLKTYCSFFDCAAGPNLVATNEDKSSAVISSVVNSSVDKVIKKININSVPRVTQTTQGAQGPRGLQGIRGIQGERGSQGPQGEQGIQGERGSRGSSGSDGTNGTNGTNGADGINGANMMNLGTGASINPTTSTISCLNDGEILQYDLGTDTWNCVTPTTGTDSQSLTLVGNLLSLTNGGNVDLSSFMDDTDTTYSAGNGIGLSGTTFAVSAPTCTGTQKLQWTGSAFVCAADVDTNSGGTVTSVAASGGTTGLTFTGTPITSSGTLTLGGTLALANGGTGATTAAAARTNLGLGSLAILNAVTTTEITDGTIVNADVSATANIALSKLANGNNIVTSLGIPSGSSANGGSISANVLTLSLANGTNPGLVSTGTQTFAGAKTFISTPTFSTMTQGSVLFAGPSGILSQNNSQFFWDNANNRLGINTSGPDYNLTVGGNARISQNLLVEDSQILTSHHVYTEPALANDLVWNLLQTAPGETDPNTTKYATITSGTGFKENFPITRWKVGDEGTYGQHFGYVGYYPNEERVFRMNTAGESATRLALGTMLQDVIFIDENQLVGIGTNSPTEKLQVAGNLYLEGAFLDAGGNAGSSGQVLSSTGVGTDWIDFPGITSLGTPSGTNANGGSISGNVLTLSFASATTPGLVSTGTQTFAGNKTFNNSVFVNGATAFNNHPLVIRASGSDVLAFQDSAGTTQWHWNLLGSGLNFAETGVADNRLFLQDGGNVGIGTGTPQATLHNSGSTILGAVSISNLVTGGAIGTAAATVNAYTTFNVNQTTANQTLTLPTPTNATAGRIAYVNNVGSVEFIMSGERVRVGKGQQFVWNGTAWSSIGDGTGETIKTGRKTAIQSIANTTTFANITDLSFAVGANETWYFQFDLLVTQNTTPDIKYTVTAPSGSTCNLVANEFETGVSAISNACGGSMPLLIASGDEGTTVSGTIVTSTTAGTIQLQAAQNSLSALATSINTGSSFVAYRLRGADLAEVYYSQDNSISEGMLVSLTQAGISQVQKSEIPYDMNVLGVVSTKPGLVIGEADGDGKPIIVGLAGRVPVKVTNQNGAIKAGDYITTSSIPGIGMKATEPGQVVGKALTGLPEDVDVGEVIVFIQNSYFDGLYISAGSTADYGQELISNDSRTVLENGSIADRLTHLVRRALERLSSVFIDFKAWIRELKAEKIETQELCVGNVCVTEQQFLELFESNNIDYSTNEEADDGTEEESGENTENETSDENQETNTDSDTGTELGTQDNSNETTTPDENTLTGESESNPSTGDETGSGESASGDLTDSNQGSDTSGSGEDSSESSPSGDEGESQN